MKICKICNSEITNKKRWVYCSDECAEKSEKIFKANERQKYIESKKSWNYEKIELNEIKHNKTVPINKLDLLEHTKTYIKWLLNNNNLGAKEHIKMKRSDGAIKDYYVVVTTPENIRIIFEKKYDVYKNNFRFDCLETVKSIFKAYNMVNDYYEKENNATN